MKVLFACHRLPFPPKRGGKIRPFNIIRHLSGQGHQVTVLTLARSAAEIAEGQGLNEYCERVVVGQVGPAAAAFQMVGRLATTLPSSFGYFYSRSLHQQAARLAADENFDLVFVHCSSAAQYVRCVSGVPSVIDFGDMDSQKWKDYRSFKPFPLNMGYGLEAIKLLREEKRLARQFDLSTCTTRMELETLDDYRAAQKTAWFPNGVDAEFFEPTLEPYDPNGVCFIGRMDYYPNQQAMLEFCRSVYPELRKRRPEITLTIVGAEPSREILRLGELPGVTVTGTVPDVRDYVRRAAVTVAPLQIARGTQNKILESMAMGVPVVCSTLASRGVDAVPGEHLVVADSSNEWVEAILGLLEAPERRQELAEAGRNRVLSNHSWSASMQKLDGILGELVEAPATERAN